MNKNLLAIIIAVIAVLAAGILVSGGLRNNEANTNTPTGSNKSDMSEMQMNATNSQNESAPLSDQTQTAEAKVDIINFDFSPEKLTIKKGTTVTWTQKDDTRHDVRIAEDYGDAFKSSNLMKMGETYSFTFNTVGTYNYFCSPHPYMKATVEVVE